MADTASRSRRLIVMADDFGIGPETSRAILELAREEKVTGTVVIVNCPYAADAITQWKRSNVPLEIGWHPNLTLDRPLTRPELVPSLVGPDGRFHSLGTFMKRLLLGRIRWADTEVELLAQYKRFIDLVGRPPAFLNGHQHIHIFSPISEAVAGILERQSPRPYVRRVREPWSMYFQVPGARLKRTMLGIAAKRTARLYDALGCPANDWLAGVTDPKYVKDPNYLTRWLSRLPGRVVELTCHPGHWDETLHGRDCEVGDGKAQRRVDELTRLRDPSFVQACRRADFQLVSVGQLMSPRSVSVGRAA